MKKNRENKNEVLGGEEEGVVGNKWMIFHGLIFFLLSLYPKLDFLCISIYHLLFAPNTLTATSARISIGLPLCENP